MTLFIAWACIAGFNMHWLWYPFTLGLWCIHIWWNKV